MQIAKPLAAFGVRKVLVSPIADLLVTLEVFLVARSKVGVERSDDGFALWPPEFHVLRIVLWWQVAAVAEVDNTSVWLVPTPFERPIENL